MAFRFGSILFQLKLTVLFMLFGLLIGYSSYFVTSISNTKILLNQFLSTDKNPIYKLNDTLPNDWMLKLGDVNKKNNTREIFQSLFSTEFKDNIALEFFYKNAADNNWYMLGDTSSPDQNALEVTEDTALYLDDIITNGLKKSDNSFCKSNNSILYVNVTRPGDKNIYAVKIKIDRKGLIHFISVGSDTLLYYTVIILFLSLIVGIFFAKSISTPIRKITDRALAVSKGDFSTRFKLQGKDDISELSRTLNTMAINIENRITTIETMNKIDKAVNSSLSRKGLLKKVIEFVYSQFSDSACFIMEKQNKAYHLLASAPDNLTPEKDKIMFSELPANYLLNNRNIYRLTKEDTVFLKEYFHAAKFGNSGVSIPLIQSENLVGVLVVVKTELVEREIDTLELLADQVSLALLSVKEVEDRKAMYNAMLLSLTRSVDTKSRWTAGHSERVTTHAVAIAEKLGLDKKTREKIRIAALLHDIGKLGVPEAILDKPDKLTDEEFEIIRKHPAMGEEIIKDIPHFSMVKSVVRHHHEKWDGTGYPDGLSKDSIPFAARIVAIADVWDAITADRPYRKSFSHAQALEIMKSEKGKLFDPALLDIFIQDK